MSKYTVQRKIVGGMLIDFPPPYKKIGGKDWRYYMAPKSKSEAETEAKRQTTQYGLLTKVVRWRDRWAIYFRNHD